MNDHDDHAGANPISGSIPNAKVWLDVIASGAWRQLDPDNAAAYLPPMRPRRKAALDATVRRDRGPPGADARGVPLVVTMTPSSNSRRGWPDPRWDRSPIPTPADPGRPVVELQAAIAEAGAACFLSDPGAGLGPGAIANLVPGRRGPVPRFRRSLWAGARGNRISTAALLEAVASGNRGLRPRP